MRRNATILMLLATFIAFAPLVLAIGAGYLGEALGCTVHEGFSNPCPVFGMDIGGFLYALGVMGWLSVLTLPAGFVMLLVGLGLWLWSWPSKAAKATGIVVAILIIACVIWFFTGEL